MAHPTQLDSTGRNNLDVPPAPTTPPEAAPRIAQLAQAEEGSAQSIGSLQQSAVIFQTGMAVEKGIIALANLLPQFAEVAQSIIPQIRAGITQGLQGSGGSAAPGGATNELPAQAVSPLQQG
jgi:hypothetical protein